MAEHREYAMTHEAPNDTELALLNVFIDQQVEGDLLRHQNRMFDLLAASGLIVRSNIEHSFIARK
jgi:hypothetical protein